MRLVQVLIPRGSRESVLESLDGQGVDYAVFEEVGRGDFEAMVQFPVPPSGVETVMEKLTNAGVRDDSYTIVLPTETVVSQRLSALKERFPGVRISREELHARAEDLAPANSTFFSFLILSTVIAATGLLLDSAATIIGAMVVAPLMGPAVSASVGAILADQRMATRGVVLQVTGLAAAIATATVLGVVLQQTILIPPGVDIQAIPQVAERTSPNVLSLFLALGSGIAGAISIMRGSGSTLVGVAIAVALVPPAATSGLGIAFGLPAVAVAGAVLVVVNLLAINLSALILFYLSGFKPLDADEREGVRTSVATRIAVIGVGIAVLSLVLAGVTYASFQTASFEQQTQAELQRQFDEADIEGVELVSVTVDYRPIDYLLGNQPRVDVLVGIPRDLQAPPDLAQRFDDQLTAELGRDVVVRVGFVEAQVSDEDAELLINGDAFGLWEFTDVDGLDKFDALVDRYPELFDQFEATGERVPITLIPGNHDYERVAKDAPNEETWFQRLVTPAPGRGDDIPSRTVVRPTTESSGAAATNPSGGDATTEAPRRPVRREERDVVSRTMDSDANAHVLDERVARTDSASGLAYWGPAVAVSLAMFIGVIDSTLMNVAIPSIVTDLDTTVTVVQGAISFYAMVMAALILPGGKLSSMYGVRRLMTATFLVYGVGTTLAALSWNVVVLYVGWSVIEGAAAAVLLPLTFTVLLVSYEGADRAKALGILAGVNAAGAAFGPLLGGAVTTFASWRWGFGIEVLIVLVALAFVRYLPEASLNETPTKLDIGGTLLSVAGTTALVAGVLLAGRYGWLAARRPFVVGGVQLDSFGASPTVWLVGIGVGVFAAFVQYERRVEREGGSPLVPVRLLSNGAFTAGIATNAVRSLVLAGFIFVVPVFLQTGAGYTAFETGVAMLPFSVATFVASVFTTGWRRFVAPKLLVQAGVVLMGIGVLALASQTALDATVAQLAVPMALVGLGLGLVMAQLIDMTLSAVDQRDSAAASGLLNATMMLGYSFGTAIVGTYLLRRFYDGVVDGVLAAAGASVSASERGALVAALETAAETATEGTQRAFLAGLTPAQRELLAEVFDAAIVQAQRATLFLLALFALLVLLVSTLLPDEGTSGDP